jgi:hypothetical protein
MGGDRSSDRFGETISKVLGGKRTRLPDEGEELGWW